MRNLAILRDSVCAIDLKAADDSRSELVRLCIESDTGNVYVADVTHGTVYCLSSNSQVSCVSPITQLIQYMSTSAFEAPLCLPASSAPSPNLCRSFGRKACKTPQAMDLGLTARLRALLSCLIWKLFVLPRQQASCCWCTHHGRFRRQVECPPAVYCKPSVESTGNVMHADWQARGGHCLQCLEP